MAIGSILGSVAGGLAAAGGSALAGKLFGGRGSQRNIANQIRGFAGDLSVPRIGLGLSESAFQDAMKQFKKGTPPSVMRAPGLHIGMRPDGAVNLFRAQPANVPMRRLRSMGDATTRRLTGLLGEVRPGFGRLTDARVQAVETARQRAAGDLKENLSRRRVSGSSFANDAAARTEREFADAESAVRAQSFLEELEASRQLLDQRFNVRQAVVETELGQVNFETGIGAELLSRTRQQMEDSRAILARIGLERARMFGDASIAQARLAGDMALGAGELGLGSARLGAEIDTNKGTTFGRILEPAITKVGGSVGDFFSNLFGQPRVSSPTPLPRPRPA